MFSLGRPRGYNNEALTQLELEMSFGVGSYSRELKKMARKELGCARKTVTVRLL
jgi:hypothetical protein